MLVSLKLNNHIGGVKTMSTQPQNTQPQVQEQEKLRSVTRANLTDGTYKVFYVGKIASHNGTHGKFVSISIGIENTKGIKAWLSVTEKEAYKVLGITSATTVDGGRLNIKEIKVVTSGTYKNIYYVTDIYHKPQTTAQPTDTSQAVAIGDLSDFEEILSAGDVPF